jgi:cysteine desulfurase
LLVRDLDMLDAVGGQEQGYRPGTQNLPGISGMVAALELGSDWLAGAAALRGLLDRRLVEAGAEVVGEASPRSPAIGAYRMPGVPANAQLIQFDLAGVAVSAGSACSSGSLKPSHVLAALGWDERACRRGDPGQLRSDTSAEEVEAFASLWIQLAGRRRAA